MAFSTLQEEDFFGRSAELSSLLARISRASDGRAGSVVLSGRPGTGKTELLQQLFGHLFWKQKAVVPFLYSVHPAALSSEAFARDYLVRYLCHHLAFQTKEQVLLRPEGMSVEELSILLAERGTAWALDLLDRFERSAQEPLAALAIAVNAPRSAYLATGAPSVILIDSFHRLAVSSGAAPVSLFEASFAFGRTPHILTGNASVLEEMAVASGLDRVPLLPLGPQDVSPLALALLRSRNAGEVPLPAQLAQRIAGNPLYLSRVIEKACSGKVPQSDDYWRVYAAEIGNGGLCRYWTAILKDFFPDLPSRITAVRLVHKLCHTPEGLSCSRLAKALALSDDAAERLATRLHLAGFIRGEFGVFRRVEDRVLHDVVEHLYEREVAGSTPAELERKLLEQTGIRQDDSMRFEMTLPMQHEVELIAARSLEQIGENLQLDRDAVGQMQVALIEACINAIEHTSGSDRNLYLTIAVGKELMEVSVESSGQEFVVQETQEPVRTRDASKTPGRGWGIKLMKRFVDEVRFEKTRRGTKTVLTKKFAVRADVQKEKIERE